MKRIRSVFFISLYVWVNPYKYSFFIRILKAQYVGEAESFKLFKARLKSFLNM